MANFDNLKKQAKLLVRWHRAGNRSVWIAPDVRSSVRDLVSDKHNQKLGKFPGRCVAPSFGERGSVQLPSSPFERSEDGVAQVYPTHSEIIRS